MPRGPGSSSDSYAPPGPSISSGSSGPMTFQMYNMLFNMHRQVHGLVAQQADNEGSIAPTVTPEGFVIVGRGSMLPPSQITQITQVTSQMPADPCRPRMSDVVRGTGEACTLPASYTEAGGGHACPPHPRRPASLPYMLP